MTEKKSEKRTASEKAAIALLGVAGLGFTGISTGTIMDSKARRAQGAAESVLAEKPVFGDNPHDRHDAFLANATIEKDRAQAAADRAQAIKDQKTAGQISNWSLAAMIAGALGAIGIMGSRVRKQSRKQLEAPVPCEHAPTFNALQPKQRAALRVYLADMLDQFSPEQLEQIPNWKGVFEHAEKAMLDRTQQAASFNGEFTTSLLEWAASNPTLLAIVARETQSASGVAR